MPKITLQDIVSRLTSLESLSIEHKEIKDKIDEMEKLLQEHDKILIRGNGKPSMAEDLRNVKSFIESISFWLKVFGVAFIGQFIALIISIAIIVLQALPALERLAAKP